MDGAQFGWPAAFAVGCVCAFGAAVVWAVVWYCVQQDRQDAETLRRILGRKDKPPGEG